MTFLFCLNRRIKFTLQKTRTEKTDIIISASLFLLNDSGSARPASRFSQTGSCGQAGCRTGFLHRWTDSGTVAPEKEPLECGRTKTALRLVRRNNQGSCCFFNVLLQLVFKKIDHLSFENKKRTLFLLKSGALCNIMAI